MKENIKKYCVDFKIDILENSFNFVWSHIFEASNKEDLENQIESRIETFFNPMGVKILRYSYLVLDN